MLKINFYFGNKFVLMIKIKQKLLELILSTSFVIVINIDNVILSQIFLKKFVSQNCFR